MRNIDMKNTVIKRAALAAALTIGSALPIGTATGQSSLLLAEYAESYVVLEGDTLYNIASQFLEDPMRWPKVWQPDEFLDEPNRIFPGDI